MHRPFERAIPRLPILEQYLVPEFKRAFPRPVTIKILMVCEGLQFDTSSGFSFKVLIDAMRDDAKVAYANFRLTLATWAPNPSAALTKNSTPGPYEPTYSNYRFASHEAGAANPILDGFDEVWLFGIGPNTAAAVGRDAILDSPVCPTHEDLVAVTRWMNAGGGVLAMGDHASLGAHLCANVPRVWTMRRWTAEDGAPPIGGPDRVDTNRPMISAQDPSMAAVVQQIPFEAQSDDVAQPIEVRRYPSGGRFFRGWRPHPVLCGGQLGVIDVLPDHPHEGWIRETGEIALGANVGFSVPTGVDAREYPTVGAIQPRPEVIAWGNTLADPPHDQFKGDSPHKRFGIIGAYDGHQIALGRVVVDSTWHHWMSVNLSGTYVSDDPSQSGLQPLVGLREAGGANYDKILTYFRNTAVWLAPPARQRQMLSYLAFWAALSTYTFEDWRLDTPILRLGSEGRDVLGRVTSNCFVGRWIFELLPMPIPERDWDPIGPGCLSCPPEDWLEAVAIGTLIRQMMLLRDELLADHAAVAKLGAEGVEKAMAKAFESAGLEATQIVAKHLEFEHARLGERVAALRRGDKTRC